MSESYGKMYGDLLKAMRVVRGKGQREMARLLKMDSGNYNKLETGKLSPPPTKRKIDIQLAKFKLQGFQSQMFYESALKELHLRLEDRFWK